jgi:hypothetical protein
MNNASNDPNLNPIEQQDDCDIDCSSIQFEQPDRLAQLNARYDAVLDQIDVLDSRIQRLLAQIPLEKT